MKKFFCKCFEIAHMIIAAMVAIFFFGAFFKLIVEPFAPIITVFIILFFTFLTFERWITALLSIGGIALIVFSWPIGIAWDIWLGILTFIIGVLLWALAIYKSFKTHPPKVHTTA